MNVTKRPSIFYHHDFYWNFTCMKTKIHIKCFLFQDSILAICQFNEFSKELLTIQEYQKEKNMLSSTLRRLPIKQVKWGRQQNRSLATLIKGKAISSL